MGTDKCCQELGEGCEFAGETKEHEYEWVSGSGCNKQTTTRDNMGSIRWSYDYVGYDECCQELGEGCEFGPTG